MIEVIKTSIAAGETKNFLINGGYFEVLECAYPIDVLLMDKQGSQRSILKSAEASYFNAPGAFEVIQITSAQAQDVRFFVGDGTAGTRRVAGVVSVVDGGKNRTISDVAFMSAAGTELPAAGFYSNVALKNPAASGKRMIVKTISANAPNAMNCNFGKFAVGLASVAGDVSAISKNFGGAVVSAGLMQVDSVTYNAPFTGGNVIGQLAFAANLRDTYKFDEPVVVAPGQCLRISANTPAVQFVAGLEWFEESI